MKEAPMIPGKAVFCVSVSEFRVMFDTMLLKMSMGEIIVVTRHGNPQITLCKYEPPCPVQESASPAISA